MSCFGGTEVVEDCQTRGAFCNEGTCVDWRCTPGERACTPDMRFQLVCSARGDEVIRTECVDGFCSPATLACVMETPPPVCAGTRNIAPGESVETNLCGDPDSNTFQRMGPNCDAGTPARSGDETFVLDLPHEQRVTIELTDIDESAAIDTIVYVRRDCLDPASQVACHDDVPCGASTVPGGASCSGGVDVRQSRLTLTLPIGRYYIVADAFLLRTDRVNYTCGRVRLSVTPA